ncbi:MAG TPA: group II truncated hemoglobin [Polyangiaceae bacterium]
MAENDVPTLHAWVGGTEKLETLFARFYERVRDDALLAPIFADMHPEHHRHVAAFVAEVFGGPPAYSEHLGGHAAMVRKHLGKHLNDAQRKHWMNLLLDTADEVGVPTDPEFRSALVGYLEWGSRLAVMNSQPGAQAVESAPMPVWNWGAPGGPYVEK